MKSWEWEEKFGVVDRNIHLVIPQNTDREAYLPPYSAEHRRHVGEEMGPRQLDAYGPELCSLQFKKKRENSHFKDEESQGPGKVVWERA